MSMYRWANKEAKKGGERSKVGRAGKMWKRFAERVSKKWRILWRKV